MPNANKATSMCHECDFENRESEYHFTSEQRKSIISMRLSLNSIEAIIELLQFQRFAPSGVVIFYLIKKVKDTGTIWTS